MSDFDPSKYYSTWQIEHHPEGLTREEVEALGEDRGASHDMIFFSMIHTADGGLSTLIDSRHHTGRELDPSEYFKAWTLLTALVRRKLVEAGEDDGPGSRLSFIATVWETICSALVGEGSSYDAAQTIVDNIATTCGHLLPEATIEKKLPPDDEDGIWGLDLQHGEKHASLLFSLKQGWQVDGEAFADVESMLTHVFLKLQGPDA